MFNVCYTMAFMARVSTSRQCSSLMEKHLACLLVSQRWWRGPGRAV